MRLEQTTYDSFRSDQKSFTSRDGVIKYIDKGKGPVIVLLHGVPTSGWLYRKMIDPLVKSGYRVIVPDMLGFGSSDSPKGYEVYSEEMHAQRLLELMDAISVDSWTHVMHDAGGLWTWELLEVAPEKVQNLVILNSIIYEEGFDPPIRFKPGFMARVAMWGYRNGITTNMMLKGLFDKGLTENTLNKTDVEGYKRPLKEGKTKGMYYFFTQTCNALPEYQPMIQKIEMPAMIIWGKNDTFLQLEPQQEALQKDLRIADKDVHIMEAKHFIQEEKPQEIVQMILAFIKQ
ncbi:alpha/beta hydrolase [uncultured Dokdonia sp.]|uniref:alpha/beta fold hydrolase n=1 Tax=uncultured Dokdonia sp. TaxID=575653 RepID=UPI0026095859|nr:alpha/beta hydrolase [uncultured Dokdonia sp.]